MKKGGGLILEERFPWTWAKNDLSRPPHGVRGGGREGTPLFYKLPAGAGKGGAEQKTGRSEALEPGEYKGGQDAKSWSGW